MATEPRPLLSDPGMRDARRLGGLLGVYSNYGIPAVRDSVAALRRGEARPDQQLIVAQMLDVIADVDALGNKHEPQEGS